MPIGIGTAIGLGSSLIGGIFGGLQRNQARKLERNNILPLQSVNSNILANQAMARQQAQVGLAQSQYNQIRNQQNGNLATVLSTASRTGRNIPVAGLLRQANIGTQNLNIQDAQARQQNQRLLMQQNGVIAQEEQRVFNWNKAQPYLRTAQQVASMRNAGTQNIFGGIGTIAQMGIGGAFDKAGASAGLGTQAYQTPNFYQQMNQYGLQNNGNYGGTAV